MASQKFPRWTRLLQPQGFSGVLAYRKSVRSEHFQLSYHPGQAALPQSTARLGVVAAKKLMRRAVQRNRIKRQGREVFRLMRADLARLDLVLRLTKRLPDVPWRELRRVVRSELETLFAKLPR